MTVPDDPDEPEEEGMMPRPAGKNAKTRTISVVLSEEQDAQIRAIAQDGALPISVLVRQWIVERLREIELAQAPSMIQPVTIDAPRDQETPEDSNEL